MRSGGGLEKGQEGQEIFLLIEAGKGEKKFRGAGS